MSLENLQQKIKRKMSEESKKQLIVNLTQEILKICPYTYDPAKDEMMSQSIEDSQVDNTIKFYPDYPENDLSKIDDQDLTKQELLENLGCTIMQQLYPMNLRLAMLNAHEVFRREIIEAKEKGIPEPHKNLGGFHRVEPLRDKLERCFGICNQYIRSK